MTRFAPLLLAAFLAASCAAPHRASARRPNVLVILTDDQGTLDARCYGATDLYTPAMDSIAARGIRFTQAYSHTVCCPARALLLTGRHPQRSNVNSWQQGRPAGPKGLNMHREEITLAEALRDAGYRTALFGKWHLGAHPDHGPTKQGFERFFGIRGGFIDNYNHHYLHRQGYHDLFEGTKEVFAKEEYFPDLVTGRALEFIEKHRNAPFFLYLAFNIPHYPEQADPRFDMLYRDLPEPRRSLAKILSTTDDRIGHVISKLEELGLRDDTIIVFQSDNGHSSEDYQIRVDGHASGFPKGHSYGANGGGGRTGKWRGAKGSFFEGGIRVPAMISYPAGLPEGIIRDQVVTGADWFPTVLELCGVPLPRAKLDGKSLLPVIRDDAPTHHRVMHWQWQKRWAVREGDWKLIVGGRDTTDPWQGHPDPRRKLPRIFLGSLSGSAPELKNHAEERPGIVKRLTRLHEEWIRDVMPDTESER